MSRSTATGLAALVTQVKTMWESDSGIETAIGVLMAAGAGVWAFGPRLKSLVEWVVARF